MRRFIIWEKMLCVKKRPHSKVYQRHYPAHTRENASQRNFLRQLQGYFFARTTFVFFVCKSLLEMFHLVNLIKKYIFH